MVNQSKDIIQVQGINSQGYGIIPKMVMQISGSQSRPRPYMATSAAMPGPERQHFLGEIR